MAREVVFVEQRDEDGLHRRWISVNGAGDVAIEGHDLGPGVERAWGSREYEFARTVAAADVPALLSALDIIADVDLLDALRARFENTLAVERYLAEHEVPTTFWSRVGD